MSNVRRKKTSPIMWVVIFLCIAMLGVAVSAALTQGFTNADPYGWLEKAKQGIESLNKEEKLECPIKVGDKLTTVYFDKSVSLDFTKLDWSKAEDAEDMGEMLVLITADVKENEESDADEIGVFFACRIAVDDIDGEMEEMFPYISEDTEYVYILMARDSDAPLYVSETMVMETVEVQGFTTSKIDLTELYEVKVTQINEADFLATFIKLEK